MLTQHLFETHVYSRLGVSLTKYNSLTDLNCNLHRKEMEVDCAQAVIIVAHCLTFYLTGYSSTNKSKSIKGSALFRFVSLNLFQNNKFMMVNMPVLTSVSCCLLSVVWILKLHHFNLKNWGCP